jgi:hypothetical protein
VSTDVRAVDADQQVPLRFHVIVAAVFLACSVTMVWKIMDAYPWPSPIDEVVHFDYIHDVPHVPVNGERISEEAQQEWACRGDSPEYALPLPACNRDGKYNPDEFPGQGFSTAGSTPPFYYAVTAAIAKPLSALTGKSLFALSRSIGALWLTALMMVIYFLALRLRAGPVPAVSVALLTGTLSAVVSSAATMGPDTATAVVSGVVLLAALGYDGTRKRAAYFLLAVAVAALTKFTAFAAVGAAVIYLVVLPLIRRGMADDEPPGERAAPSLSRSLLVAGGGLGVFGVLSYVWGVRFQDSSIIDPDKIPINVMLHADTIDWGSMVEGLIYAFFSPGTGNWQPQLVNDPTNAFLTVLVGGAFILGVLAAALSLRAAPRLSAFGIGLIVMVLVSGFLLTALNFYVNHLLFGLPPRYGYALLPGLAAVVACLCSSPGARRALALVAVLSVLNMFT